jgi:hypothetical protein
MSPFTRILFPRPSIFDGLARLFDSSGSLNKYNTSRTPAEADIKAMTADWNAVGEDIWDALEMFEEEYVLLRSEQQNDSKKENRRR